MKKPPTKHLQVKLPAATVARIRRQATGEPLRERARAHGLGPQSYVVQEALERAWAKEER